MPAQPQCNLNVCWFTSATDISIEVGSEKVRHATPQFLFALSQEEPLDFPALSVPSHHHNQLYK